ncbi:MAG: hemolysin D [Gemmatales bacterium]|nr:MAG: hemolysin D [Gemmatales bacterium]
MSGGRYSGRVIIGFVLPSAALLAMVVGCNQATSPLPGPQKMDLKQTVKVVRPEKTTLERITIQPATVVPFYTAKIHAKVSGYLKELNVDIGTNVNAGDILAVIDVPELQKEREGQDQKVKQLEKNEKRALAGVQLAEANIQACEALVLQAKADIARAEASRVADFAHLQRIEKLVASNAAVESLLDEARKRYDSSEAACRAAKAALSSANANVLVARARLANAEAELDAARAETAVARKKLEEIDAILAYATLKAPFKGIVTARHVDPGDLVRDTRQTGQDHPPLFEIAHIDVVRIRVVLPENDVPWADQDDQATVTFRSLPGKPFSGKITRIARSLDEGSRTMVAEIDLKNPDGSLLPGMYGEARIVLETKKDCIVLPARSIRFDHNGQSVVYVVQKDHTIAIVPVQTGLDNGKVIEILSGLQGDEAVVNGTVGRLKQGQSVIIE